MGVGNIIASVVGMARSSSANDLLSTTIKTSGSTMTQIPTSFSQQPSQYTGNAANNPSRSLSNVLALMLCVVYNFAVV